MPSPQDVKNALTPAGGGGNTVSKGALTRVQNELEAKIGQVDKLKAKLGESKEMAARLGMGVVYGFEAGMATFIGSVAEGRWGSKIKLFGKVDARILVGGPMYLMGLIMTANGSKHAGHMTSTGGGLVQSFLASHGREMGEAWRDKKDAPAGAANPTKAPTTGGDEPDLSGLREITQHTGAVDDGNRFREVRAI